MKLSKITAALSAAVMAAGMLTAPVSAEPPRDPFTRDSYSVDDELENGLSFYGELLVMTDDNGSNGYTGLIKLGDKKKYYETGYLWTGWRKIGGKWYYFDPDNGGVMAEEKAKTALGTYYLDEDGAWNGKVSRSALLPDDFTMIWELEKLGNESVMFNTSANSITFHSSNQGFYEIDSDINFHAVEEFTMSRMDKQIFYDVLMSCGLNRDLALSGYEISKTVPDDFYYTYYDYCDTYDIFFDENDNHWRTYGDENMYQFYGINEDVRNFAYFMAFTRSYVSELPQYAKLSDSYSEAKANRYNN